MAEKGRDYAAKYELLPTSLSNSLVRAVVTMG